MDRTGRCLYGKVSFVAKGLEPKAGAHPRLTEAAVMAILSGGGYLTTCLYRNPRNTGSH